MCMQILGLGGVRAGALTGGHGNEAEGGRGLESERSKVVKVREMRRGDRWLS